MIPYYPESVEITIDLRDQLHPLLKKLPDGISEFTFANLYLFQNAHKYRVSKFALKRSEIMRLEMQDNHSEVNDGVDEPYDLLIITGSDKSASTGVEEKFFMLPLGIPVKEILDPFFDEHITLKCASEKQAQALEEIGYQAIEDRDNFDYLYKREHLADLPGRHYHKKRNLIKAFVNNNNYEGLPLLDEYLPHAMQILDNWRQNRVESGIDQGDYQAAKEALINSEVLQLCGFIYYVEDEPVAYSLGEELACGTSFVVHFEKAVSGYKGLWQFVNQAFASIITEKYLTINREQDLGDEGLRHAKLSYHPTDFVKKFKIRKKI